LLRKDLEELMFTGRSHMPEGLEAKLDLQQMADLFAFIGGKGPPPKSLPGNRPQRLRPADDGSLALLPANAEIYGDNLKLDLRQQALVDWTSAGAYAAWSVEIIRVSDFDVWLDWACAPDAAGSGFVFQSDRQAIPGRVAATGGWADFRRENIGHLRLTPGRHTLALRPEEDLRKPLMNLRAIRLLPAAPAAAIDGKPPLRPLVSVKAAADGSLSLGALAGRAVGPNIRYQPQWRSWGWFLEKDRVLWLVDVAKAGPYDVWLEWAVDNRNAGHPYEFRIGDQRLLGAAGATGSWETYQRARIGRVKLGAGPQQAVFAPNGHFSGALLDLRRIRLVPAAE
jgi:hypothetical protein